MNLRIFFLNRLGADILSDQRAFLERVNMIKPVRKFVVFERGEKSGDLSLVFGPWLNPNVRVDHSSSYRHIAVRDNTLEALKGSGKPYYVRGGGQAEFSALDSADSLDHLCSFGGESDDLGIWDPRLLLMRHEIVVWLDMPTSFLWKDTQQPPTLAAR